MNSSNNVTPPLFILPAANPFMRRILVTIFLSNLISFCYAGKITGTITDNEGNTLPYASVLIKGTTRGTNANNEGKYSIYLEPGQYTLVCQHVGYKSQEKSITVALENLQLDFTLKLQELVLGEVMVTMGNNPANEIIRNTIKKRIYYRDQLTKFQCQDYTNVQLRLINYPTSKF